MREVDIVHPDPDRVLERWHETLTWIERLERGIDALSAKGLVDVSDVLQRELASARLRLKDLRESMQITFRSRRDDA